MNANDRPGQGGRSDLHTSTVIVSDDTGQRDAATAQLDYAALMFGDARGYAHVESGIPVLLKGGRIEHKDWAARSLLWPEERDRLTSIIAQWGAAGRDVFVCPYLTTGKGRDKGTAVERRIVHADIDGLLDYSRAEDLGASVMASGRFGHGHVYALLDEDVPQLWHEELSQGLGRYFGPTADLAKHNDNDLLRPPGTFNHKPPLLGEPLAPVEWEVCNFERRFTAIELAGLLGVTLPPLDDDVDRPAVQASSEEVEPVDMATLKRGVREALEYRKIKPEDGTRNRSDDTLRVVDACVRADYELPQIRFIVNSDPELAERLAGRTDDDVARCYDKAVAELAEEREFIDRIAKNGSGHNSAATEPGHEEGSATTESDGKWQRYQLNIAARLAAWHADTLMYVHGLGWHYWAEKCWRRDESGHAHQAVRDTLQRAWKDAYDDKALQTDIRSCQTAPAVRGVLELAATLPEFAFTIEQIDSDPWLLNCANGTLDLRTRQLRPHDPADRITKITRGRYDPSADQAVWRRFLDEILPDPDVQAFLQRGFGQAVHGKVREHLFLVLTGSGANGKTTTVEAVAFTLGEDYARPIDPNLLLDKGRGDRAGGPEMMRLRGARLVTASESSSERHLDAATMKRLTGGDTLTARHLFKEPVTWRPSHQFIYITNDPPKVKGDDEAAWRRIFMVLFGVRIEPERQDPRLGERLEAEADAILTWCVQGWYDYEDGKGMRPPASVIGATARYRDANDDVRRFVAKRCRTLNLDRVPAGDLYAAWQEWARDEGAEPLSDKMFGKELVRLGFTDSHKSHGVIIRHGLTLLNIDEDEGSEDDDEGTAEGLFEWRGEDGE